MIALTNDQIRSQAPAVFATKPHASASPRYKFLPTIEIVDELRGQGWFPVRAEQGTSRGGRYEWNRHQIRFRTEADLDALYATNIPELVLTNSHDLTTAESIDAGIFRVTCENGLVCSAKDLSVIAIRHVGGHDWSTKVKEAARRTADNVPALLDRVNRWSSIQLTSEQVQAFADAAIVLRGNPNLARSQVVSPRRFADHGADLWTVTNVVQENILRGGQRYVSAVSGRKVTTRALRSIGRTLDINKAVWELAESFDPESN